MLLTAMLNHENGKEDFIAVRIIRNFDSFDDAQELLESFATQPGLYSVFLQDHMTKESKRAAINVSNDGTFEKTHNIGKQATTTRDSKKK